MFHFGLSLSRILIPPYHFPKAHHFLVFFLWREREGARELGVVDILKEGARELGGVDILKEGARELGVVDILKEGARERVVVDILKEGARELGLESILLYSDLRMVA